MGDVKRYATVVIKRLDDSWALADWVPDDAFIALEIKYDALRARLAEVERERESVRKELVRAMDVACNSDPDKSELRILVALLSDIGSVVAVITGESTPTQEPPE